MSEKMDYRKAAQNVDWMQILLNLLSGQETGRDGQPCFHIDPEGIESRFCGRAKFWAGHGSDIYNGCDHEFVPILALLDKVRQGQAAECAKHVFNSVLASCMACDWQADFKNKEVSTLGQWQEHIRALGRK